MLNYSARFVRESARSVYSRSFASTAGQSINHVAIVGTGPSGFYTAKYILDQNPDVRVDLYEKWPVPFGLVRYGVAPDHPEVKSVTSQFAEIAANPRVRYFGNIEVGQQIGTKSISLDNLRKVYGAVVLTYGASSDLSLGLQNEDAHNVVSAREFVNWYNGFPDYLAGAATDDVFSLKNVKNVVIIGHGNVALDCARILTDSPDILTQTDISSRAMAVIRDSRVQTVTLIGRRGHVQAAFTIKEFRELTKLGGVSVEFDASELEAGLTVSSKAEMENNRPRKRIVDLIEKTAKGKHGDDIRKCIKFRFLTNPVKFVTDSETGAVSGVEVAKMTLQGEPYKQRAVAATTSNATEVIPCQLVLKSIGYKCEPIADNLKLNPTSHTVPHAEGRVVSATGGGAVERGLYVAGWLKRGPTGIIGTNINDARETAAAVVADLNALKASVSSTGVDSEYDDPVKNMPAAESSVLEQHAVSWEQFLKIDAEELRRGAVARPMPKSRDKLIDTTEMIQISKK